MVNADATNRRRRFIAFHEAGHAVAADRFGIEFIVTIEGEPQAELESLDSEIACCINFAGPIAQARFQRRGLATVLLTHGHADWEFIEERATEWGVLGLKESKLEQWRESARQIINARWMAVETVAARLLERGQLTSDEVQEIVSQLAD